MSLEGSHWIRGYLYDASGSVVNGATVTVQTISGTDTATNTTTTGATGYYQINVQTVCNDGDLIRIRFTWGGNTIDEFIRVNLDDLTQEVNATLENQMQIDTNTTTFYLPYVRWDSVKGETNKNIQIFNFWDGSLDGVDIGLNDEPFTISGYMWIDAVYTRDTISGKAEGIINLQNEHEEFTLYDINSNVNGVYVLKNFRFKTVRGSPNLFEWEMTLIYAGD